MGAEDLTPAGSPEELAPAYHEREPFPDFVEPSFLRDVVEGLIAAGRTFDLDLDLQTLDIDASDPETGRVLAVVRSLARSVTFYAVHPRVATDETVGPMTDLVVRATNDQFETTFELDPQTGAIAVRSAVSFGEVTLAPEVVGALLDVALVQAEETAGRYRTAIDDVLAGRATPERAAADARMADVVALQAEIDGLRGV